MRYALISDIHANLPALEAMLTNRGIALSRGFTSSMLEASAVPRTATGAPATCSSMSAMEYPRWSSCAFRAISSRRHERSTRGPSSKLKASPPLPRLRHVTRSCL